MWLGQRVFSRTFRYNKALSSRLPVSQPRFALLANGGSCQTLLKKEVGESLVGTPRFVETTTKKEITHQGWKRFFQTGLGCKHRILWIERKKFTLKEVYQHRSPGDVWIIIHGKVYDISKWVFKHPGGLVIVEVRKNVSHVVIWLFFFLVIECRKRFDERMEKRYCNFIVAKKKSYNGVVIVSEFFFFRT